MQISFFACLYIFSFSLYGFSVSMDFANFSVKESWGKGFVGNITVNNATKTLWNGWHFTLKAPFEITKIWNAEIVKKRGDTYLLRSKPVNAKLLAGQTVSLGFVGKFDQGTDKDTQSRFSTDIYAKANQPKLLSFKSLTPEQHRHNPVPRTTLPSRDSSIAAPAPQGDVLAKAPVHLLASRFVVQTRWPKGFSGKISFVNNSDGDLSGWTLEFVAPFEIIEIWNAKIAGKVGDRYSLTNGHRNTSLKQGQRTTFNFIAKQPKAGHINNKKYQPKQFTLAADNSYSKAGSPIGSPSQNLSPQPKANSRNLLPNSDRQFSPTRPNHKQSDHKKGAKFNYGEALQKSFLFYEAQRAGKLPDDNRIDWRDDSVLNDGKDVGLDLSGGYFDAGDNVKFGRSLAVAMTLLSWGASEYQQAYRRSGQLDEAMDAIKWGTDYILNAHVTHKGRTKAFYGQVGLGELDHQYFGRVEEMKNILRPSLKIDAKNPGSDLAADSAAALASAALVFQSTQPSYARQLIRNAKQLYAFARQYQGRYSDSIAEAANFHKSWDGYQDELAWAATWIYKATGEKQYLRQAEALYDGVSWTQSPQHKNLGTSVLLAQERPENLQYQKDAETWLDKWVEGSGGVTYTPGGFAWAVEWGSARTAATAAFISGVYGDTVTDPQGKYAQFATSQIDYLLGDNPNNFSYMVGFGDNYARQPHHRNAAGTKDFRTPKDNRHIIYGALVGGLTAPNDDAYQDIRRDYVSNEVAIAYNGGFTGALVQQYDKFGGTPLTDAQLNALPGISVDVGQFG